MGEAIACFSLEGIKAYAKVMNVNYLQAKWY
jgi:hypothetical protein